MQFQFSWQEPSLQEWESQPIHPLAAQPASGPVFHDLHLRIVAVEPPGPPVPDGPFHRVSRATMGFHVFPPVLFRSKLRRQPVQPGDTLGLSYHLIPGLDLFFASRVTTLIDDVSPPVYRCGFTYQTLLRHPQLGEETFCVEKVAATGEVRFIIKAWSRPRQWLARLFQPLTRHLQLAAGRSALDHMESLARILDHR